MDIVLNQGNYNNLDNRLFNAVYNCKIENVKKSLSLLFNDDSIRKGVNYIGELNKNDVMF